MTSYLIDMDGVLVHGQKPIPGATAFLSRLQSGGIPFLILTNNSMFTPGDLAHRLQAVGLPVQPGQIFTSAMATARFLQVQKPGGTAFVIGDSGLTGALHDAGYILTEIDPDFVVLGETFSYNYDQIKKAVRLVMAGAHFIATNPDPVGPGEHGVVPACGAMAALIETASGRRPFFIGKPNPFMMRAALHYLGVHSEETTMIGDRMDTDIVAGIQSGLGTILVLSGVTAREQIAAFPYQPGRVLDSVAEIDLEAAA
ncbi:MAG TPA: HAD-IIA family hydrolase [Anaerolineaceae bacterium]|jgi:NagD protein|nr:HAD-IIA family hydrolase [Anaerolineaceae bacterium]